MKSFEEKVGHAYDSVKVLLVLALRFACLWLSLLLASLHSPFLALLCYVHTNPTNQCELIVELFWPCLLLGTLQYLVDLYRLLVLSKFREKAFFERMKSRAWMDEL